MSHCSGASMFPSPHRVHAEVFQPLQSLAQTAVPAK